MNKPTIRPAPRRSSGRREAMILAVIAAPILLTALVAVVWIGGSADTKNVPSGPLPSASGTATNQPSGGTLVYPDSPNKGPSDAKVTLVEFLDPECESCRAAYPVVEKLMTDYGARLRLVVRYVPGHGNSALAIVALEEAGRQGRYWEMLDLLFARQPAWGERATPQAAAFLEYGAELGLDVDRLKMALESPDLSKVRRDEADGIALGVAGTPTFFVNGVKVDPLSEARLRSMIDAALSR